MESHAKDRATYVLKGDDIDKIAVNISAGGSDAKGKHGILTLHEYGSNCSQGGTHVFMEQPTMKGHINHIMGGSQGGISMLSCIQGDNET